MYFCVVSSSHTHAGLEPIVVPNMLEGDEVRTDMAALAALIESHAPEEILCVLTTTSCFAPRAPDRLVISFWQVECMCEPVRLTQGDISFT